MKIISKKKLRELIDQAEWKAWSDGFHAGWKDAYAEGIREGEMREFRRNRAEETSS